MKADTPIISVLGRWREGGLRLADQIACPYSESPRSQRDWESKLASTWRMTFKVDLWPLQACTDIAFIPHTREQACTHMHKAKKKKTTKKKWSLLVSKLGDHWGSLAMTSPYPSLSTPASRLWTSPPMSLVIQQSEGREGTQLPFLELESLVKRD